MFHTCISNAQNSKVSTWIKNKSYLTDSTSQSRIWSSSLPPYSWNITDSSVTFRGSLSSDGTFLSRFGLQASCPYPVICRLFIGCKTTVRLHLRQSIQSLVVSCMITYNITVNVAMVLLGWEKVQHRPFAKCFKEVLGTLLQWPTFFLPHFCVAEICSMQPTFPSVVFMRQLCIHLLLNSLLAACLQTAARTTPTRFVWAWFGLARSHGDLRRRLWWLRLQPPSPHSSPIASKYWSDGFSYLWVKSGAF